MISKPFKVYLMGASLGTGNRGVSALGASLVKLILENRPDAQVHLLIGQRTNEPFQLRLNGKVCEVAVANFRRSPTAPLNQQVLWWFALALLYRIVSLRAWRAFLCRSHPLIRGTAEADFVGDIRGGDSFSDIYGLRNFLWGCIPVLAVLLVRRQFVILPQTIGPFKSRLACATARYILRRASHVICRDEESMVTAEELTGSVRRAELCPDVAFCLDPQPPSRIEIEPPMEEVRRDRVIGLNVNGLVYNGGYSRANMFGLKLDYRQFLVQLAKYFLAEPANHLLLVPHTFAADDDVESDPAACRLLREQLPMELRSRVHLVNREYDQGELKAVIGLCGFFVGSRMHACIAALSQGIPTVGVAYSKKFGGVFKTVGMTDTVIDGRTCTAEQALHKTVMVMESRNRFSSGLRACNENALLRLRAVFRHLFSNRPDGFVAVP